MSLRNRTNLLLAAMLLLVVRAAHADTLLTFEETASISVHPDELVATVRSEILSASPAEAQTRVNEAIAAASDRAHHVAGIEVATGGYDVWRVSQPADRWQASQTLELRSHDAAALLDLVGKLQSQGLLLGALNWRLSDALMRQTEARARQTALGALRGRAEEAALTLGLKFVEFRSIRMDSSGMPSPRMMAMPRAMAASAPVAETQDVDVSETVAAEAVLQAR